MADIKKIVKKNVDGDFFVDTTCINCDTCRQLAPEVFADGGEYSYVCSQPKSDSQKADAGRALISCPTGSIGSLGNFDPRDRMLDFPLKLDENVYYCGFNSPKSFGGNSYFVRHPEGNWLVDSPKFVAHLVQTIAGMGGIKYIFLTHRDDVAEAQKYARKFSSTRIIHKQDLDAQPDAELVVDSLEPHPVGSDFLVIPTPGHTRGHCVLLYRNRYLFTGDHLAWSRENKCLTAFRHHCWYSWQAQIESMRLLLPYEFEWILTGHGQSIRLDRNEMGCQLEQLIEWMEEVGSSP